jgi:[NiFe] hydrogenase diaphorase moiety large subunit
MIRSNYTSPLSFDTVKDSAGLKIALKGTPTDVIETMIASSLKGRGGAGFPTGLKWKFAAATEADVRYVICNADEGEPGTFKDRVIFTEYADLVFDGMTIAAYAIGSKIGIVYLRGEYTYLRPLLEETLKKRRQDGYLGKDIGGKKGFDFDIEIKMGAGAYVCGEETALIESLEGHRGEPRNRPPFPVDTGFHELPSIVNNVETFGWVACICAKGAPWFKGFGTDKSAGLKLFSISGDCIRPGVYEFPFGVTINDLLKAVGGEGAKAVQVGGASGICVPAHQFKRKIAFEDVATGGSVIVFGPQRDMLKVAENFLEFFVEESCGQCTPCRDGNPKLLEGVQMLARGECSMAYLKELCALSETLQLASKCGLGQSSPNAFLSIVEHFKDELMGRSACAAHEV